MTTKETSPSLDLSETCWAEIAPTAADLHVVLTADRFFSGRAAIEKAEELRRLRALLGERDIDASAMSLEGASLDVSSGLLTRSSSVTYRVRIHLTDLDLVAAALDAVAHAKSAQLSHVSWDYSGPSDAQAALLADCATRAAAKAKALAAALGVELTAVRTVREVRSGEDGAPPHYPVAMGGIGAARKRGGSIGDELAGLELAPKKKVSVSVAIVYEIAGR